MEFEELDEDAAAMAAAMGFSTFGSHKPPAKKRKFNPATDAFVSGQELEAIDRGGKKGKGSGGNTIPLGKMRQFGAEKNIASANEDEIDIDDDEEDDEGTVQPVATRREIDFPKESGPIINQKNGPFAKANVISAVRYNSSRHDDPRLPVRKAAEHEGNKDEIDLDDEDDDESTSANKTQAEVDGPAYIDTSEAAPTEVGPSDAEAIEMQARIDAILASIEESPHLQEHPIPDKTEEGFPSAELPNRQSFGHPRSGMHSPRAGSGSHGRGTFSDTANVASSRPSHGRRNPRWFEGYYDPSFNENPWKKLEAEKGLEAVGTWLEPPNDRSRRS